MQVGLVVGLDPGQPVFECEQALPAGHHVGEVPDVPGQGVQVRAAGPDRGEPGLVAVVEAGGAGQQPAEMLAPSLLPSPAQLETAAALERAAASPMMAAALVEAVIRTDVRSLLCEVTVPALVIHRKGDPVITVGQGRYLAEHIPGAEYVELAGAGHLPWAGDTGAVRGPIELFARRFGGQRRLPRTGTHPRPARAATGWGSLTEAERGIAVLVAEGLSNPAIASRLFLSRHTVESHLKHAYAKLGVSSRVELAALTLREEGKNP